MIENFYKHVTINITLCVLILILIPVLFLELVTAKEVFALILVGIVCLFCSVFLGFYLSQQFFVYNNQRKEKRLFYFLIGLLFHELQYNRIILERVMNHMNTITPSEMVYLPYISKKTNMVADLMKKIKIDMYFSAQQHIHIFTDNSLFTEIELAYYDIKIAATVIDEFSLHLKEKKETTENDEALLNLQEDIEGYITKIRDDLTVAQTQLTETITLCKTQLTDSNVPIEDERYSLISS